LRTETAGVVVCSIFSNINYIWIQKN
jgi:hypothetical protein